MIGIFCDLSADADNGWVCFLRDHYHARLAPVLREDGRFLRDGRHIILHPSFSFSERIRTALNGGICMKGALRFMQYVFLCLLQCEDAISMDPGETVTKKPLVHMT